MTSSRAVPSEDWFEIEHLSDRVSRIRERYVANWLRCNIWLIQGREYDLLIDSGLGLRPLGPLLTSVSQRPLTAVMTHCHFDHIGGAHEFENRQGHHACKDFYQQPLHAEMQAVMARSYMSQKPV